MAAEKVFKDGSGIYARLFDHKAVVQSECKFHVREFETKRNDREFYKLKESVEKSNHSLELVPQTQQLCDCLPELEKQLVDVTEKIVAIVKKEEMYNSNNEMRVKLKEEREKHWEDFQLEIKAQEEQIQSQRKTNLEKLKEEFPDVYSEKRVSLDEE